MTRTRRQGKDVLRQWLGLSLALLLALAPPFNLAGVDLALQAQADSSAHAGHQDGTAGHDHSGLAHHSSASACLQCLALGGMALAGAAIMPESAPQRHPIVTGWAHEARAKDSRGTRILVCRGPPARICELRI